MGAGGSTSTRLRRAGSIAVAIALLLPLLIPGSAAATKTVGISKPSFQFNVAAGQSGSDELVLANDGTEPINVMVYVSDLVIGSGGKVTYETPSLTSGARTSPGLWLRLQMPEDSKAIGNVPYVELAPGQQIPVKFTFQVPKDAPPGDHQAVLFFEMFEFPGPADEGTVSRVSGRIGARIRLRVQGEFVDNMEIAPFAVPGFIIGGSMPYSFTVLNKGNLDKSVEARIAMLDGSDNEKLSSTVMKSTTVLSKSRSDHKGSVQVGALGLGRFTARLTLSYPKGASDQAQPVIAEVSKDRSIWVIPMWVVVLGAILVAAAVAWLVWRGMARRKPPAAPPAAGA